MSTTIILTPVGETWIARLIDANRSWRGIASSSDGVKVVAVVTGGYIYISTDSGANWTSRMTDANRNWYMCASSSDGTKLVATNYGGYIYTSTDSGLTWTNRMTDASRNWYGVASSSDGYNLIASVENGRLYTSTDSGVTWTARNSNRLWSNVASSSDGTKLVANHYNGQIYTSTDSGENWTARDSNRNWLGIASSSDGTKLVATHNGGGYIYTSTDSGANWTARDTDNTGRDWTGVTSSSDGTVLAACVNNGGYIYTSTDSGVTWLERNVTGNWHYLTISSDGTKLAATNNNGYIHTSTAVTQVVTTKIVEYAGANWKTGNLIKSWNGIATSTDAVKLAACVFSEYIFTSTDSGANWLARTSTGTKNWNCIASSGDGTKLIACAYSEYIYTSTDSGATWKSYTGLSTKNWGNGAASSGNGTILGVVHQGGYIYISTDSGSTWSSRMTDATRNWFNISSSYDGTKMVACVSNSTPGYIYTSTDSGVTWIARTSAGSKDWHGATISNDGTKLSACVYNEYIYTSTDSGVTWTVRLNDAGRQWIGGIAASSDGRVIVCPSQSGNIYTSTDAGLTWLNSVFSGSQLRWPASSSDGTKLMVCINGGRILTSESIMQTTTSISSGLIVLSPIGETWTARLTDAGRRWFGIASSSNGNILISGNNGGYLYVSTDSGVNWASQLTDANRNWYASASSSDGSKLFACVNGGYIYTSTDTGVKWTMQTSSTYKYWLCITSSSDGTKIAAGSDGGQIYTSTDSGVTWTARMTDKNRRWFSITSSSNGVKLVAGVDGEYIYTSTDSGVNWSARMTNSNKSWDCIGSSSDGTKLFAGAYGEYIYTSTDSGVTWMARMTNISKLWLGGASSSDGTNLVIIVTGSSGYVYTSNDSGITWNAKLTDAGRYFIGVASSSDGSKVAATVINGQIYTSSAVKILPINKTVTPVGTTWITRLTDTNRAWSSIAQSSDGVYVVATVNGAETINGGFIYTSTDSGVTWSARMGDSSRSWYVVASSSNGAKLVATVNGGQIYTSTNYGATWTARDSNRGWFGVASSSDGTKLVATVTGGQIYTSVNSGVTWTARASSLGWRDVASSSNGSILAATVYGGQIYTSTDSGVNWKARMTDSNRNWVGITLSSDGTKMVASIYGGGYIYTSTDSGITWTVRDFIRNWIRVSSSSDGTTLAACENNNGSSSYIYTSTDGGLTWLQKSVSATWNYISMSNDGYKIYAVSKGTNGYIYTSTAVTAPLPYYGRISQVELVSRITDITRNWSGITVSNNGKNIVSLVNGEYIYTSTDSGLNWIARATDANRNWQGIASSSDGTKLVATSIGGYIYTSTDYGKSWTIRMTDISRNWYSVASSSDGSKLVTANYGGYIYTSTDSGENWTSRMTDSLRNWSSLSSSSDGNMLFAKMQDTNSIYTSTDAGINWRTRNSPANLLSIICSSDGSKLAGIVEIGYIYTSTDSGLNWKAQMTDVSRNWKSIASSSTGQILVSTTSTGIYISNDYGASWKQQMTDMDRNWGYIAISSDGTSTIASNVVSDYVYVYSSSYIPSLYWSARLTDMIRSWSSIASSYDGTKFVAGVNQGYLYTSTDSGVTWNSRITDMPRNWSYISSSNDGTKLAASYTGGYFTSTDSGINWNTIVTIPTSNIALWLDASDLSSLQNNSQVTQWKDKSNSSLNSINFGSGYPVYTYTGLNNLPSVLFNNGNIFSYSIPANTFSNGITVFAVYQSLASNNYSVFSRTIGNIAAPIDLSNNVYIRGDGSISQTGQKTIFSFANTFASLFCIQAQSSSVKEWAYNSVYNNTDIIKLNVDSKLFVYYTFNLESLNGTTLYNYSTGTYSSVKSTSFSGTLDTSNNIIGNACLPTNKSFNLPDFSAGNDYSLCFWIYLTQLGNNFWTYYNGGWYNMVITNGVFVYNGVSTNYTLSLNTWYHIAFVGSSITNTTIFYVNGVQQSNQSVVSSTGIGNYTSISGINGNLDDFRFYTRTLSQSEIVTLYNYKFINTNIIQQQYFTNVDNTNATYTDNSPYFYIGGRGDKGASFNGYISEIIVYNTIISDTQRQSVEGYLSNKWNLSLSILPITHPYRYGFYNFGKIISLGDGTKLLGYNNNGYLYQSTNFGSTWTAFTSGGSGIWNGIASSTDGKTIIAGMNGGYLYVSTDSGLNWLTQMTDSIRSWSNFASSANGNKLVVTNYGGYIYTSNDSGITWTARLTDALRNWNGISSSADGSIIISTDNNAIYLSTNSGVNWSSYINNTYWTFVTVTGNGKQICSSVKWNGNASGYIYIISTSIISALISSSNIYTSNTLSGDQVLNISYTKWMPRLNDSFRLWNGIASSSDGMYIAATNYGGYIYTSSDSGVNWKARMTDANRNWNSIASSSDGTKLIAIIYGGYIYTSTDYGVSWKPNLTDTPRLWAGVASSSYGNKLVANVYDGYMYTSTDGGISWNSRLTDTTRSWNGVASSSNGNIIVAVLSTSGYNISNYGFYISRDSGVNWIPVILDFTSKKWCVALSTDGTKIVLGSWPGFIYTSTDTGANWTARMTDVNRNWSCITSSGDGLYLIATNYGGFIYTSTDSGLNWKPQNIYYTQLWRAVASSIDGTKIVSCVNNGYLFTSNLISKISLYYDPQNNIIPCGTSWINGPVGNYMDIKSSADFTKIIAASNNSNIITSTDSGANWLFKSIGGYWTSVSISGDGTNMVAGVGNSGGYIYTSNDSGVNWVARNTSMSLNYTSIASSYDGKTIIACTYTNGACFLSSTDSGVNWKVNTTFPLGGSDSVAITGDKQKWFVVGGNNFICSTDSGVTWKNLFQAGTLSACAISVDGRIIVLVGGQYLYTSNDSGLTWTTRMTEGPRGWCAVATSADGSLMAAICNAVYISRDYGVTWKIFPVDGGSYGSPNSDSSITISADGTQMITPTSGNSMKISREKNYTTYPLLTTQTSDTQTNIVAVAGVDWVLTTGPSGWGVASSSDGKIIITSSGTGFIHISKNAGLTWTATSQPATHGVASSSSGAKLACVVNGGYIYTSTDTGVTWNKRMTGSTRGWLSIVSSSDGSNLAVTDYGGGYIWTSSDAGENWIARMTDATRTWYFIASSSSGKSLIASVVNGYIYTSSDFGVNWVARLTTMTGFQGVSISSDGTKMAANRQGGSYIYTSSDSGVNWTARITNSSWYSSASSSDGSTIVACAYSGYIYISTDSGETWNTNLSDSARSWRGVTMTSDGKKIIVTGPNLYVSSQITTVRYPPIVNNYYLPGVFWTPQISGQGWNYITSSNDGTKLAVIVTNIIDSSTLEANTPITITNLQLWLDASDFSTLTITSGNVFQWNDKSGLNYHATIYNGSATYVSNGFNSLPAVQLNASGFSAPSPSGTFSNGITFFVVFQKNGASIGQANEGIINKSSNNYPAPFDGYGIYRLVSNNTGYMNINNSSFDISTATGYNLLSTTINSTNWNEFVNGSSTATINYSTTFLDYSSYIYIGSRADKSISFRGVVSEVIVYNRVLTTIERQRIEGYLAKKWNIVSSLPTNHTYYNTVVSAVDISNNGMIYTSTDSGVNWKQSITDTNINWKGISSSSNGNSLVAVSSNNNSSNTINSTANLTTTYGSYTLYTFTTNGSISFPSDVSAQVLIVGGGGGGGYTNSGEGAGGGGAGSVGVGQLKLVSRKTYSITVGNGGSGGIGSSNTIGKNGENSSIIGDTISETANGGGYGGSNIGGSGQAGGNGGSGGGGAAGWQNQGYGTSSGGSGTLTYYANNGGQGYWNGSGGSGGGASAAGTKPTSNSVGANGGSGYIWTINSTPYGGGGGGGAFTNSSTAYGTGGIGGGGTGGPNENNGTVNTGGGGGGGSKSVGITSSNGGNGGSGIVIIAVLTTQINNISNPTIVNGSIYTSSDSGLNWTKRMTDTSRDWSSVASSADGTKLIAVTSLPNISLYTFYTFTNTSSISFPKNVSAQVLIVGGGGGGGAGTNINGGGEGAGGGGAGAVGVGTLNFSSGTSYSITIGAGGNGGTPNNSNSSSGGNTSIVGGDINEIAYGGGYGGSNVTGTGQGGGNGGSGGGGAGGWDNTTYSKPNNPTTTAVGTINNNTSAGSSGIGSLSYYGNAGGAGLPHGAGGSGGGASSPGTTPTAITSGSQANGGPGANGGSGYTWSINSTIYGGGGGGGGCCTAYAINSQTPGSGGSGGGGNGGYLTANGKNGTPNTGGGGGGSGSGYPSTSGYGGNGGSGIVIIAVLTSDLTENTSNTPNGYIYTSTDSGENWVAQISAGIGNWYTCVSSVDGSFLVAAIYGGQIAVSNDYGISWNTYDSNRNWTSITSSSDGKKLAAVVTNGYIYTSTDYGITWNENDSLGTQKWYSITSSKDGNNLVATVFGGYIYTSYNSGVTWIAQMTDSTRSWTSVTSSSDGSFFAACVTKNSIYTSIAKTTVFKPYTRSVGLYSPITSIVTNKSSSTDIGDIFKPFSSSIIYSLGQLYIPRDSNRSWYGIASSYDGTTLVAAVSGGYLYTSTDTGMNWTAQMTSSTRAWQSVAISSDGTKMVSGLRPGVIYTSTDSGINWTARATNASRDWYCFASSSDGNKLIGVVVGGNIYTSSDSGVNWIARATDANRNWQNVTSSSDGTKLVAVVVGGYIYTSSDSGVNWIARFTNATRNWFGIASSGDGTKLVASHNSGGYVYTSTDSGLNWTARDSTRDWMGVTSSGDGKVLAGCVNNGGYVYISTDGGLNWKQGNQTGTWRYLTLSYDGTKLAATSSGGQIYTSEFIATTNVQQSTTGITVPNTTITTPLGTTYTKILSLTIDLWTAHGIACSNDGLNIVVTNSTGYIYTSTDGGLTWKSKQLFTNGNKVGRPLYTNGILIFAGGLISTNFGASWISPESQSLMNEYGKKFFSITPRGNWYFVASSSDETVFAAFYDNDYIYTSTDSGVNWTKRMTDAARRWTALAISNDGTKLFATVLSDYLYSSTDSGVTWTKQMTDSTKYPRDWGNNAIVLSSDASTVVVSGNNSTYISNDFGVNWTTTTLPSNISAAALSADGTKLIFASYNNGNIYSSTATTTISNQDVGQNLQPYVSGTQLNTGLTTAISKTLIAGQTWTSVYNPQTLSYVTISGDGTTIIASGGNFLSVSTDAGVTWTIQINDDRVWTGIASSYDGQNIAACCSLNNSYIYTSTDAGQTWTSRMTDMERAWFAIASSTNGNTLIASQYDSGYIYTSTDSGINWTSQNTDIAHAYRALAISSNGTIMFACDSNGYIYASTNSGLSWAEMTNAGSKTWSSIALSNDGTKVVALVNGGYIYTSTDSGITWATRMSDLNRSWKSVASTNDGTKLVACVTNEYIYTSTDSGVNWKEQIVNGMFNWNSVSSSSDGKNLVVSELNGKVYTSFETIVTKYLDVGNVYQSSTKDTSLFMYYTFDSSNGNKVYDYANSVYNGILINSASITTNSIVGPGSLILNSAYSQYMTIAPFINPSSGVNGMSFSFWFRAFNSGRYSRFFEFGSGSNGQSNTIYLSIFSNTQMQYRINGTQNIVTVTTSSVTNINNGAWYHCVWVLPTTGNGYIYMNGDLASSYNFGFPATNILRTMNSIGKSNWGDPYFIGQIDDFRGYNKILTGTDVTNLYIKNNNYSQQLITTPLITNYMIQQTNLIANFDANVNVTSYNTSISNIVSIWTDKYKGVTAYQNNNSIQPLLNPSFINSYPAIDFGSVTGGILTTNNAETTTTNLTLFFVMKMTTYKSVHSQFCSTRGSLWSPEYIHMSVSGGQIRFVVYTGNSVFDTGFYPPLGTPFILMFNITTTGGCVGSYRYNGSSSSKTFTFSSTSLDLKAYFDLGGWAGDSTRTFGGGIGEFIQYNRTLPLSEIQQVESYLSSKWGISIPIPRVTDKLTNLIVDLDANVNVTSSSNKVSNWTDIYTNVSASQSTSSKQPLVTNNLINSYPAIDFGSVPGSFIRTNNAETTTTDVTLFFVMKISDKSGYSQFCSTRGTGWGTGYVHLLFYSGELIFGVNTGSPQFNTGFYPPVETSFILMVNITNQGGCVSSYRYNGNNTSTTWTHSSTTVNLYAYFDLGGWESGRTFAGCIGEFIQYNRTLSLKEIQKVESYLSQKWGITIPLITTPTVVYPTTNVASISILWLDAADSTTITLSSGTNINQWKDKSFNGYSLIQNTLSNQPIYTNNSLNGYSGIKFSSIASLYQLSTNVSYLSNASSMSIYVVLKTPTSLPTNGWGIILTNWLNSQGNIGTQKFIFSLYNGGIPGITLYANGSFVASGNILQMNGTNAIVGFTISSTSSTISVNGNITNSSGAIMPTAQSTDTFYISDPRNQNYTNDMVIYEILGFDSQLSKTYYQEIEGYLAWKWGLQSSLPITHPYYNTQIILNNTIIKTNALIDQSVIYYTQYKYLKSTSTSEITGAAVIQSDVNTTIYILAIGGGGAGAYGGGGAGGFVETSYNITRGKTIVVNISVGNGGNETIKYGCNTTVSFNDGTTVTTFTAYGGGGGGLDHNGVSSYMNGASGGGAGAFSSITGLGNRIPNTTTTISGPVQGYNGFVANGGSGGPGGGAGSSANNNGRKPSLPAFDNTIYYAGGGGGTETIYMGGLGGGGTGNGPYTPTAGTPNTGGGGGGLNNNVGKNGGSGIVILSLSTI